MSERLNITSVGPETERTVRTICLAYGWTQGEVLNYLTVVWKHKCPEEWAAAQRMAQKNNLSRRLLEYGPGEPTDAIASATTPATQRLRRGRRPNQER